MSGGVPWSDADVDRLIFLADKGWHQAKIAKYFGRHQSSIDVKARKLGVNIARYAQREWSPENTDRKSWTEADRICAYANVPIELAKLVTDRAWRHRVSVKWLRSDAKHCDLIKCRTDIALRARELGYSYPIIARALNRDHSSVMHLVQVAA